MTNQQRVKNLGRFAQKGNVPWNKGKKGKVGVFHHSEETKEKIRQAHLGKKKSEEHKKKLSEARLGKPGHKWTMESRIKASLAQKGPNHYRWGGGAANINAQIRRSLEYRLWRESVFERDDWICQDCGQRGGNLNADHIKPFCDYPELRFELSNGRTLCKDCHVKTDTYGWKFSNKRHLVSSLNK